MDNIITPVRAPTSKKWQDPPQRNSISPEITSIRYEEGGNPGFEVQFNNIPDQVRIRNIPQLIPLISISDTTKRNPYYVLHNGNPNQQITEEEILRKARFDYALKDIYAETPQLTRDKAIYNIFSPFGLKYGKAHEGLITNQPPWPAQNLYISNVYYLDNTVGNNLSNAGTNYE